jgi:hypothetical protein
LGKPRPPASPFTAGYEQDRWRSAEGATTAATRQPSRSREWCLAKMSPHWSRPAVAIASIASSASTARARPQMPGQAPGWRCGRRGPPHEARRPWRQPAPPSRPHPDVTRPPPPARKRPPRTPHAHGRTESRRRAAWPTRTPHQAVPRLPGGLDPQLVRPHLDLAAAPCRDHTASSTHAVAPRFDLAWPRRLPGQGWQTTGTGSSRPVADAFSSQVAGSVN